MAARRLLSLTATAALLTACVTINVYFPAVAAEEAADRIIGDVWGPQPSTQPEDENAPGVDKPAEKPEARAPGSPPLLGAAAGRLLDLVIAPAAAQSPNIDINTPAVRKLTRSMEQRHQQLKAFYGSGAVGLTNDALVAVRDLAAVPLAKRNSVKQLVNQENGDRKALYAEIARANDHPEWESKIRDVFARRWIANAQPGWYYQNAGGGWVQK